jgi:hypothetical protein
MTVVCGRGLSTRTSEPDRSTAPSSGSITSGVLSSIT